MLCWKAGVLSSTSPQRSFQRVACSSWSPVKKLAASTVAVARWLAVTALGRRDVQDMRARRAAPPRPSCATVPRYCCAVRSPTSSFDEFIGPVRRWNFSISPSTLSLIYVTLAVCAQCIVVHHAASCHSTELTRVWRSRFIIWWTSWISMFIIYSLNNTTRY